MDQDEVNREVMMREVCVNIRLSNKLALGIEAEIIIYNTSY